MYKHIKEESFLLNQFMENKISPSDIQIPKEILLEINELIYRIQIYEIKLLTNSIIYRQVELIKLWWNYKTTKN